MGRWYDAFLTKVIATGGDAEAVDDRDQDDSIEDCGDVESSDHPDDWEDDATPLEDELELEDFSSDYTESDDE